MRGSDGGKDRKLKRMYPIYREALGACFMRRWDRALTYDWYRMFQAR